MTPQVTDNAQDPLSVSFTVTVNLVQMDRPPQLGSGNTFSVREDAAKDVQLGVVSVTGATKFEILDGNHGDTFSVDSPGGQLKVASRLLLDFEVRLFDAPTKFEARAVWMGSDTTGPPARALSSASELFELADSCLKLAPPVRMHRIVCSPTFASPHLLP